jgi:hypothetical protein
VRSGRVVVGERVRDRAGRDIGGDFGSDSTSGRWDIAVRRSRVESARAPGAARRLIGRGRRESWRIGLGDTLAAVIDWGHREISDLAIVLAAVDGQCWRCCRLGKQLMLWLKLWSSNGLYPYCLVKRCSWYHTQKNKWSVWRILVWTWRHRSIAFGTSRRGYTGSCPCGYARYICVWREGTPPDQIGRRQSDGTPDSQKRN